MTKGDYVRCLKDGKAYKGMITPGRLYKVLSVHTVNDPNAEDGIGLRVRICDDQGDDWFWYHAECFAVVLPEHPMEAA